MFFKNRSRRRRQASGLGDSAEQAKQHHMQRRVDVWATGFCDRHPNAEPRAAFCVFYGDRDRRNVAEPLPADALHNKQRADVSALLVALAAASEDRTGALHAIHTDSEYGINCLSKWAPGWKKKGWVTKMGEPVKNRDIIEPAVNLFERLYGRAELVLVRKPDAGDAPAFCRAEDAARDRAENLPLRPRNNQNDAGSAAHPADHKRQLVLPPRFGSSGDGHHSDQRQTKRRRQTRDDDDDGEDQHDTNTYTNTSSSASSTRLVIKRGYSRT